jgi:hypothetical protein
MAISIASMINGWGLDVKSWGWVIGGHVGILICTVAITALKDE